MHYRVVRVAIFNAAKDWRSLGPHAVMLAEAHALVDVSIGFSFGTAPVSRSRTAGRDEFLRLWYPLPP
jgi:hypothetical protein